MRYAPSKYYGVLLLTAAFAVAGCRCKPPGGGTGNAYGELDVVYDDENGISKASRDATYDFGAVFMGQQQTLKLVVQNRGAGSLNLDVLEKDSGDAVSITGGVNENTPVFTVAYEARALGVSETTEYVITFQPPQDPVQKVVEHQVKLILRATNTDPELEGGDFALVTLKGRAVSGVCELPKTIDFGAVAKDDSLKISTEIKNPTQLEATASASDIYSSSGDHLAFTYTIESSRGTFTVPVNSSKFVIIEFKPTEMKSYLAFAKMRASAQCPEYVVQLIGQGVDNVLTWSPSPLDFGYVSPGAESQLDLTFKNASKAIVNLTNIATKLTGEFKVVPAAGADPTKLTVPASSEVKLKISFKPGSALGPKTAALEFSTTLLKQPTGAAVLKGYAGGPAVKITPAPTLSYGKVAYFANASPPVFQNRKLTVMNVGTKPIVPDPKANLYLGQGGNGKPYYKLEPLENVTDTSEITITDPASYNPAVGLEASAGKNIAEFMVKFTPAALPAGSTSQDRKWKLTVYTNDPSHTETVITIAATVVLLPPCNYSTSPTVLNYGLVSPPSYRDLAFTITNNDATNSCILSNLDIAPGSDAIYSLPAGPIDTKELQPGEKLQVIVRAWPQGQTPTTITPANGQVQFYMSSDVKPLTSVSLQASIAASCLTIAPNDWDFGTVKKGCNSSTKTFNMYNTCPSTITIPSITLQAAAGQPAGGPDCPGLSPCPEFFIMGANTPITLNQGSTPVSFSAKFAPIDYGAETGAIAINAVQGGQNVTYVVTLQGTGGVDGLNTDIFQQDAKPKADILLVIDNSCSMYDKQQALATNFASFIKYAIQAGVDYHIAVTTTDDDSGGEQGKFVSGVGNPETVLTPQTPDVENKFKAKVNLGTNGSANETGCSPALKALTAPLITSTNSGFLRNDAVLAIVVVTDAPDQSVPGAPYYLNQYLNVKGMKRANMFTFNAVAGFDPNPTQCSYDTGPDDGKYLYLVTNTNGVKDSICTTTDWAKTLEALGKSAFGFRTNFFLNGTPDLTGGKNIEVKINGNIIPNVDSRGATIWSYDPLANSVNFDPMFVPEPGDTLSITYYVTCY